MTGQAPDSSAPPAALPDPLGRRWPWLIRLFRWYVRGYLARHFHAVRLLDAGSGPALPDGPLVVALSHPGWWDPLLGVLLSELFGERDHVAPIEAAALAQYRFFERLGFFGLAPGSRAGYQVLLGVAAQVLARPTGVLWITPQGHFADVRQRPLALRPGVGHVLAQARGASLLPVALEYCFWNERLPEALVAIGPPLAVADGAQRTPEQWTAATAQALTAAQDELAAAAMTRDPARFATLIAGRAGQGGVYDWWRRLWGRLRGRPVLTDHDQIVALARRLRPR